MKIVSDTGPIIGLAKIGRIFLLKELATKVLIPPFVHRELYGKIGTETEQIDRALKDFIQVTELGKLTVDIEEALIGLDEGERQSICLAFTFKKDAILLIDDQAGRQVAENLKIPKTGLVGTLLFAKRTGLIQSVGPLLQELRTAGYWLSDEILAVARKIAEE